MIPLVILTDSYFIESSLDISGGRAGSNFFPVQVNHYLIPVVYACHMVPFIVPVARQIGCDPVHPSGIYGKADSILMVLIQCKRILTLGYQCI